MAETHKTNNRIRYSFRRGIEELPIRLGCLVLVLLATGCRPAAQRNPDPEADVLRHPELWSVIGRSVEGRTIYSHEQGTGDDVVLVVGSTHGDEAVTGKIVVRLVELISLERRDTTKGRVIFLPYLNPDGVAHHQRTNAHGVDINRNLPTRNWSPTATEDRYPPGPSPSSEPETRLLLDLLLRYNPRLIISLHAPLHVINYDGPAKGIADRMAALNGYRVSDSIGYATPGSLGTYAGVERNIPVITLELPRVSADEAWEQNRDALMEALSITTAVPTK